jgi:glycolate oxidase
MSDARFAPVTDAIVRELRSISGDANVIFGDAHRLARYSRDQVPEKHSHVPPEAVVMPGTAAEVQAVIRLANRELIPVTPRGAGSGLSGGAIPVHGGICLAMERMNRILEVDTANLVAVVEPGVVTNKLDEVLKPLGLFFAGYPMSEEICTLGGNAAHNAGGGRAVKYGVTKRYITGLEVVTPTGEILTLGGKRFKDVTGYDLVGLLVGSEGTLGVITRITIRLLPRPRYRRSLLVLFDGVRPAIETVPDIVIGGRMVPASIEFMDRISFQEACRSLKETLPWERAGAAMLLESDGSHETQVAEEAAMMESVCRARGPLDVFRADSEADSARFWKIRKQIPWTLKALSTHSSIEDIVVPVGEIPVIIEKIQALEKEYAVRIPVFGHAGDGNLHAHPLKDPQSTEEAWYEMIPRLLSDLYRATAALGGTISGEHGIGSKRRQFLPLVMDAGQIGVLRKIKQVMDPNGILNPGKIFD